MCAAVLLTVTSLSREVIPLSSIIGASSGEPHMPVLLGPDQAGWRVFPAGVAREGSPVMFLPTGCSEVAFFVYGRGGGKDEWGDSPEDMVVGRCFSSRQALHASGCSSPSCSRRPWCLDTLGGADGQVDEVESCSFILLYLRGIIFERDGRC